jgi:parallel beta-helix repeat protein
MTVSSAAALQSAVANAVSNETISVASGTYDLTAPLTFRGINNVHLLAGSGGQGCGSQGSGSQVTLVAPPGINNTNQAIILINGATQVEINGFTINGNGETIDSAIQVLGGGSATIHFNTIENTFNNGANQLGYGIRVGNSGSPAIPGFSGNTTGTAGIENNTIETYNKGGVIVDGSGSDAVITGNTVTGDPAAYLSVDQNGVQISNGAAGRIQGNVISGNSYNFNSPITALGVEIYNTTKYVVVAQNVLNANESGIEAQASQNTEIYNNDILNGLFDGIDVDVGSSNIDVENNDVINGYGDGISLENATCNTIINNEVCGSTANDGIYLGNSNNNTIEFNQLSNNYLNGIWLQGSSYNELAFNVAQGNRLNGIEIDGGNGLGSSSCNDIQFDASTTNCTDGILLSGASGTTIEADLVVANGQYGIAVTNGTTNTTIKFNLIAANGAGAIYVDGTSSATLIQSNLIFGTTYVAQAIGSTATTTCVANSYSDADCACAGL